MAARKQSGLTIDEAFQRFYRRKKAGHMLLASGLTRPCVKVCPVGGGLNSAAGRIADVPDYFAIPPGRTSAR